MAKKKTVKKKTKKKVKRAPARPYGLAAKKEAIMRAVPEMPCSAISKDMQGLRFAHTQAEKVYARYRDQMAKYGLVVRRVDGYATDSTRPCAVYADDEYHIKEILPVPVVRYHGTWEIKDIETGQNERFHGAGDGDNGVWSIMSAQTNAKKQALLDYFETAWPQPTDWAKIIKQSLLEMTPDDQKRALQMIVPMKLKDAVEELLEFWGREIKKG